jgi:methionyl-tRNA formyltransferase
MVMALDAGDVLAQERLAIAPEDSAIQLTEKLSTLGGRVLADFLRAFSGSELQGQKQDESQVTLAAKITKEEGFWTKTWSCDQTLRRMRAFAAWPKVQLTIKGGPAIKLLAAERGEATVPAGQIFSENKACWLGCSDGALRLMRLQAPNRGPADALSVLQNLGTKPPTRQNPLEA